MKEEETVGMVRFEDGSGNKQMFWITYDGEGTFEVLEGHESYGKVDRMSKAIELIGLHARLINDEDGFFESLGLDAEDWEGTKKALLHMVDEQKEFEESEDYERLQDMEQVTFLNPENGQEEIGYVRGSDEIYTYVKTEDERYYRIGKNYFEVEKQ